MKTTLVALGLSLLGFASNAQNAANAKKETFKVSGNCEMCQKRIEKAAKINGVNSAKWDVDKKTLTLTYNPTKTNSDQVQKSIASAGYDTEKVKANDKAYKSLPDCCQYDRK